MSLKCCKESPMVQLQGGGQTRAIIRAELSPRMRNPEVDGPLLQREKKPETGHMQKGVLAAPVQERAISEERRIHCNNINTPAQFTSVNDQRWAATPRWQLMMACSSRCFRGEVCWRVGAVELANCTRVRD